MVSISFSSSGQELLQLTVVNGETPQVQGDASWLDYSMELPSEHYGRLITWSEDAEDWTRSLPAIFAATDLDAQILSDSGPPVSAPAPVPAHASAPASSSSSPAKAPELTEEEEKEKRNQPPGKIAPLATFGVIAALLAFSFAFLPSWRAESALSTKTRAQQAAKEAELTLGPKGAPLQAKASGGAPLLDPQGEIIPLTDDLRKFATLDGERRSKCDQVQEEQGDSEFTLCSLPFVEQETATISEIRQQVRTLIPGVAQNDCATALIAADTVLGAYQKSLAALVRAFTKSNARQVARAKSKLDANVREANKLIAPYAQGLCTSTSDLPGAG